MQYIPEDSNLSMNKCSNTHTTSLDTTLIVRNAQNFQIPVASFQQPGSGPTTHF